MMQAEMETDVADWREHLMSETLAVEWQVGQAAPLHTEERRLDDETWTIEISRAGG